MAVPAGGSPAPLTVPTAVGTWRLDVPAVALLVLAAVLYGWGMLRVYRRHPTHPWPWARATAFLAGLAVIGVALCSAVGGYESALFWVHMIQHLLLIMVAPVLLVVGRPLMLAMHASRNPWHGRLKRLLRSRPVTVLTCPLVAVPLYAAAVVGTHLTGFMNAVVAGGAARTGEHLAYLVVGYLYLLPGFGREPVRWRLSALTKVVVILLVMPIDTFTGVALLMTRRAPWSGYADQHRGWGPPPLTDVHWGGAVMWIGGDVIMMALIVATLVPWLAAGDRRRGGRLRWIERARRAALDQRLGTAGGATGDDVDEDQRRLDAYNAWLATLAKGPPGDGTRTGARP